MPSRRNILEVIDSFYQNNLGKTEYAVCSSFKSCWFLKKQMPPEEIESQPQELLNADYICQYKFTIKGEEKKIQVTTKKGKDV